jgi:hypothetical protein
MERKITHVLDVGIFLDKGGFGTMDHWNSVNDRLKKAVGKDSDSAGTGFGVRDSQWNFDTEEEAEAARQRVGKEFYEKEIDYCNTYVEDSADWDEDGNPTGLEPEE